MIEFQPWPKLPRLNKPLIITEKIDGTNAAVIIEEVAYAAGLSDDYLRGVSARFGVSVAVRHEGVIYAVGAQSRKRIITPGGDTDNAGFAGWVAEHAETLVARLGPGRHFGEWWGRGIQRGYNQPAKRFSLFNVTRHESLAMYAQPVEFDDGTILTTVPLLEPEGSWHEIPSIIELLRQFGSAAAPIYPHPEGIVAFHTGGSGAMFKAFLENDDTPKGDHG